MDRLVSQNYRVADIRVLNLPFNYYKNENENSVFLMIIREDSICFKYLGMFSTNMKIRIYILNKSRFIIISDGNKFKEKLCQLYES